MNQILLLGVKALVGGLAVVAFAALGEMLRPRGLAGIFAAAPSVAVASLAMTSLATGPASAAGLALAMLAGAAALVVSCLAGIEAVKRLGALRGAAGVVACWCAAAVALWAAVLR